MSASILCIGTEITRGEITNTNARWLADKLTSLGFEVTEITTVDDDLPRIIDALHRLGKRHDVVFCTGGLGPTSDDLTAMGAGLAAKRPLVRDTASIEAIRERFRSLNRPMTSANVKQADFPSGATILKNDVGTAPGFQMKVGKACVFFFPGVPREMKHLWEHHAEPFLRTMEREFAVQTRIHTFGEGESAVAERLKDIESSYPGITVGYRASFPEVEVKLLAKPAMNRSAQALVQAATTEVKRRLGSLVYAEGPCSFVSVVAAAIRAHGYRLAIAESCTGGLLAHLLTNEPASDYLVAGLVTYSNEAKERLLGISPKLIEEHGAVSENVAKAMAEGAARTMGVELGVGITGIAGPTGGSPEKPVGLVHLAVYHPGGVQTRREVLWGDRSRIQRSAAFWAMQLIRECLASS